MPPVSLLSDFGGAHNIMKKGIQNKTLKQEMQQEQGGARRTVPYSETQRSVDFSVR